MYKALKFCRNVLHAMYAYITKSAVLAVWLKLMYHGKPSAMELQSALHEDDAFITPHIISPRAADHDVTATSPMLVTSRHYTAI